MIRYGLKLYLACLVGLACMSISAITQISWSGGATAGMEDFFAKEGENGPSLVEQLWRGLLGIVLFSIPVALVAFILTPLARFFPPYFFQRFLFGYALGGGITAWFVAMLFAFMSSQYLPSSYHVIDSLFVVPYGVIGGLVFGFLTCTVNIEERAG